MSGLDHWTKLPPLAVALGIAGLLPFIGCGLGAVGMDTTRSPLMLAALLEYGAVVLAFLGAVHWGLALGSIPPAGETNQRAGRARLILGVIPSLIGWVALLLPLAMPPEAGLGLLIAGFIAVPVLEQQGRNRNLVPPGYMWLRWALTIVVVATLVTVLVLRLLGARLIF
jgi:uncharacterized membrane protein YidH (DUF202 family)